MSPHPFWRATGAVLAAATLWLGTPHVVAAQDGPMSWWGYWVGKKGDTAPGAKFLRQKQAKRFGNSVVLVHIGRGAEAIEQLRDGFEAIHELDQDVGVILMLDNLLRKPQDPSNNPPGMHPVWNPDPDCVYRPEDYLGWDERVAAVATELRRPAADGWRPLDEIVAIAGFDEVNVYGSLCFLGVAGSPAPIPHAMALAATYFPEIADRGHVWKLGGTAITPPPNAATLAGSTLPLGYYYSAYGGPWTPTEIPYCPHEGTYPGSTLPAGSRARQDIDQLHAFVDAVNAVRGDTQTPVAFIPYSNRPGQTSPAEASRGTACTLETDWHHVRCQAAQQPAGWAAQVRGFVAWQWDHEPETLDPVTGAVVNPGWMGTQRNATLQQAGKWIKRNRAAAPCAPTL